MKLRLPSPAMAVSLTALVVAAGGTGYAASSLPANSVGTKQLKNKAVTTSKVANGAITGGKVKNGSLTLANLAASARAPWALVDASGNIVAQSGGLSSFRNFTGEYYVKFPSSRLGHGMFGTAQWQIGTQHQVTTIICGSPPQGAFCVGPNTGTNSRWVYVQVNSSPTTEIDGPFYITSTP